MAELMMFICTIETTALDRFRRSWPCHGIDERIEFITFTTHRGDLVEVTYGGTDPETGKEIEFDHDSETVTNIDGGAVLVLLEQARVCHGAEVAVSGPRGTVTHNVYR